MRVLLVLVSPTKGDSVHASTPFSLSFTGRYGCCWRVSYTFEETTSSATGLTREPTASSPCFTCLSSRRLNFTDTLFPFISSLDFDRVTWVTWPFFLTFQNHPFIICCWQSLNPGVLFGLFDYQLRLKRVTSSGCQSLPMPGLTPLETEVPFCSTESTELLP